MTNNNSVIAENIKKIRKKAGEEQKLVASVCGISKTYQCYIEKGDRNIRADYIFALSKILNVNVQEFFEGCE